MMFDKILIRVKSFISKNKMYFSKDYIQEVTSRDKHEAPQLDI